MAKATKILLCILALLILLDFGIAATRTFRVTETDFVKISPEAIDQDHDKITFSYSPPLDNKGEWQTDYGDAGEYNIDITASDGDKASTESVRLIVKAKNQPPFLKETKVIVNETQTINLRDLVTDPENNPLTFSFKKPFDQTGKWVTTYGDAATEVAIFTVSDGEFTIPMRVEVTILPRNRPPVIDNLFSERSTLSTEEGKVLKFFVETTDFDGDAVKVLWTLEDANISTALSGDIYLNYTSSGQKKLRLYLDDGINIVQREWQINIANTNRRPLLDHLPISVNEGEIVELDLPLTDLDGDLLTYDFEYPLTPTGWQTGFDDAGVYNLQVTAKDGEFQTKKTIEITVIDVDRAPILNLPDKLSVKEGDFVSLDIIASDPDNDSIQISIDNAPRGSFYDDQLQQFRWAPDFDTIQRKRNFFTDILNGLRLEKFFLGAKTTPLIVNACGKELCSQKTIILTLTNSNQKPILSNIQNVSVNENQLVLLTPEAIDPDGDVIHYTFSSPLGKRSGKWQTNFQDAGEYIVYVTASDGKLTDTKAVNIKVNNNNRPPQLIIKHDELTVNENQQFTLRVEAQDPDNDSLNLTLQNLPLGASFRDSTFVWAPNQDSVINKSTSVLSNVISRSKFLTRKFSKEKAVVWLEFIASDGEFDTVHPVKVTIKNINRKPQILDYSPTVELTANPGEPVLFNVLASDEDEDPLSYKWTFGLTEKKIKETNTIKRTFLTSGMKNVEVIISDGRHRIKRTWLVKVNPIVNTPQPVAVQELRFDTYVIED
jgi:hypothetical protein